MFQDNTVFVVGAGASAEFGLPVGYKLLEIIKGNCDLILDHWGSFQHGSREVYDHYDRIYGRRHSAKIAEFNLRLTKSWQIRDGIESAESIDEYIYRYANDPIIAEVGKLHIAHAISLAEANSLLKADNGLAFDCRKVDGTWIWTFAKALMNGVRAEDVEEIGQNITIICFNYDRCIEHYLEHALKRGFHDLNSEQAREIVSKINIIHPYGWLGDLEKFPYGAASQFPEMANNLSTWSESIQDAEIVPKIRQSISDADQIVFLGFGFAAQNMNLLDCQRDHMPTHGPNVYATGLGIPVETEQALKSKIISLYTSGSWSDGFAENIHFQYGAECKKFFDIHRLNLVK